jgi:5-methylcytosine-specific restriction endonuclease McrA
MPNRKRLNRSVRHTSKKLTLVELWKKYNGECQGCYRHISLAEATRDHKTPLSKGGSNKRKNIQLMCFTCNQIKADRYETT